MEENDFSELQLPESRVLIIITGRHESRCYCFFVLGKKNCSVFDHECGFPATALSEPWILAILLTTYRRHDMHAQVQRRPCARQRLPEVRSCTAAGLQ